MRNNLANIDPTLAEQGFMITISGDGQAVTRYLLNHRTLFSAVKQGFFELVDSPRDKRKVAEVPKFAYILASQEQDFCVC